MPLQATSGAASYDAFGGGVPFEPIYIESCFATHLYTGNSSTQTITNGIDLAGKGGLVWLKHRTQAFWHNLYDTARGTGKRLYSNTTDAQQTGTDLLTAFGATGFTLGNNEGINQSGQNYTSWTFRKQPKFFDVVTYVGNEVSGRQISHNLGSVPGCIIVKAVDRADNWAVYHRSQGATKFGNLQNTDPFTASSAYWNDTEPTSTVFTIGNQGAVNNNGTTYVAYLFAHNAGGFGLTGTDNVISCGSYTGNGSATGPVVNLGYEPQWLLVKNASFGTANWLVYDNMRGLPVGSNPSWLYPNTSAAEVTDSWGRISPTATGFQVATADAWLNQSGNTIIYIAIRRGPMKVPTTGTSVFSPNLQTGGGTVTTNFPVDLIISTTPSQSGSYRTVNDRLRGGSTTRAVDLYTNVTDAETTGTGYGFGFDNNTGYRDAYYSNSFSDIYWNFRRAPGFFDEICFNSATAPTSALPHNLGVTPELVIYKSRTGSSNWIVFSSTSFSQYLMLNSNAASAGGITWSATSTTVDLSAVTGSRQDVAYLFASCPGVSKVFNYTGNGSSQTINCGFTGGARFVMIKRTDSTGNWMVVDTARGLVSAGDPTLYLNSTAAEVTGVDWIDPDSSGFIVNQEGTMNANVNGATYIGLAVA